MVEETQKFANLSDIQRLSTAIACPVERSRSYLKRFLADILCGRCFICGFGAYEMLINLDRIAAGEGTQKAVCAVRRISKNMTIGSLCKRGKEAGQYILDCTDIPDFGEHLRGNCPTLTCPSFFQYRILPAKCTGCGLCKEACSANAIIGKKRSNPWGTGHVSFEIRQTRCSKSGACAKVCPTGAIVVTPIHRDDDFREKPVRAIRPSKNDSFLFETTHTDKTASMRHEVTSWANG